MPDALECWFFLSYAWADNPDSEPGELTNVSRLFELLTNALVGKIRDEPGVDRGFLDRTGIDAGQDWDERLVRALRGCRAFVPLLTPRYRGRPSCGKEWEAIRRRMGTAPAGAQLFLPLLWDKPARVERSNPNVHKKLGLSETHFEGRDLAHLQEYLRLGIGALLSRYDSDRDAAATVKVITNVVADLIVDRWEAVPVPLGTAAGIPGWDALNQPADWGAAGPATVAARRPRVHFAVAAATLDDVEQTRAGASHYYPGADRDWIPYAESTDVSVTQLALQASRAYGLQCAWLDARTALVTQIRTLETGSNEPVLLLVDPWSLHVSALDNSLRAYDRERFENAFVVVVWNPNEHDGDGLSFHPSGRHPEVERLLRQVFRRTFPRRGTSADFNVTVRDADGLRTALTTALKEMRELQATRSPVIRPVESTDPPPANGNGKANEPPEKQP